MRAGIASGNYRGWSNVPEWGGHPRLQGHEDGLMELMAQLMFEGFDVANGTWSREHMGLTGAIVPDGLVYLFDTPY